MRKVLSVLAIILLVFSALFVIQVAIPVARANLDTPAFVQGPETACTTAVPIECTLSNPVVPGDAILACVTELGAPTLPPTDGIQGSEGWTTILSLIETKG